MLKRVALVAVGALAMMLLLASVAVAGWTPQDIYDDFAHNGKLTRDYTDDELRAYQQDPMIAMYANPTIKDKLDDAVLDLLDRDVFPFTGFQLMIAAIVVVVLIGGGVALRLLTRPPRSPEKS